MGGLSSKLPWATIAIVGANLLVFLLPRALADVLPTVQSFERALWNHPGHRLSLPWVAQLVTANFVHAGMIHLLVNAFFLLWLGPPLERALGTTAFSVFYLGSGAFAHLTYNLYAWVVPGWGTTGGASGCVFAMALLYTLVLPDVVVRLYGVVAVRFRYIVLLFVLSDVSCWIGTLWSRWPDRLTWLNQVVHLSGAAAGALYWVFFVRPAMRASDIPAQ